MTLPIITTAEASRIAGTDCQTVRRWCESELFNARRIESVWVIDRESFRMFLKGSRPKPGRPRGRRSHYTSRSTVLGDRQLLSDEQVAGNRQRIGEIERRAHAAIYLASDGRVIGEIERGA